MRAQHELLSVYICSDASKSDNTRKGERLGIRERNHILFSNRILRTKDVTVVATKL